jgi:phage gp45-like
MYDSVAFNSAYTSKEGDYFEWSTRTEDYPHTMVLFQTDQKDYLVMNKKTGEIAFTHHTGSVMRIDADGNIDIGTSIYSGSGANLNVSVSGNININAYDNITLSANGNVDIRSTKGEITFGNNSAKEFVNNLSMCMICRWKALYR